MIKLKMGLKVAMASQQDRIHPKDEFHKIYPVFLKFADQMENRGKDGVWELSVLATCG